MKNNDRPEQPGNGLRENGTKPAAGAFAWILDKLSFEGMMAVGFLAVVGFFVFLFNVLRNLMGSPGLAGAAVTGIAAAVVVCLLFCFRGRERKGRGRRVQSAEIAAQSVPSRESKPEGGSPSANPAEPAGAQENGQGGADPEEDRRGSAGAGRSDDADSFFAVVECIQYLLHRKADGYRVYHPITDKYGYDMPVDFTVPFDYFSSHTVGEFYEGIARGQTTRYNEVNRAAGTKVLEGQLKTAGWIPGEASGRPEDAFMALIEDRAYSFVKREDGWFSVTHEEEPTDGKDIPVSLAFPPDYFQGHTARDFLKEIAESQRDRPKHYSTYPEVYALQEQCLIAGWIQKREYFP